MLKFQGLAKSYSGGKPAVKGIDFEVRDGEVVGFVGLNGAGKTTTIRLAAGVILPSEGSVAVDGHDIVTDKAKASKEIGWVPELPNVEMGARAIDLMVYLSGYHGMKSSEAKARSEELLRLVRLDGFERKRLRTFSQGMKKRFALALALLPDPQNLLFDEILNGLDPEGIQFMRGRAAELKAQGKAVLLSSHILTEIENLSDRVVFLHKGRVMKVASRAELRERGRGSGALRVGLKRLDEGALRYLRTQGEVELVGSDVVRVKNFTGDPASVNAELVGRGYALYELAKEGSSLEDYFLEMVAEVDIRSGKD